MGTGNQDTTLETAPDEALVDARLSFPRLDLPPVPSFGSSATVDEHEVVPLRDEPLGTWQPPFPPPFSGEEQYRAMVDRVATLSSVQSIAEPHAPVAAATPMFSTAPVFASAPVIAPSPVIDPVDVPAPDVPELPRTRTRTTIAAPPDTVVAVMPELAPAPDLAPHRTSMVAVGILILLAVALNWASHMAFSPGLMALAALLWAQLAAGAAVSPRGRRLAIRAALPAAVLSLLALKGAIGGFSDMAMVAGLFVLVAGLPTLLLLGAAQFILHRRGDRASATDVALREGWKLRFGALAALLVAALLVRDSFSAKPDAFVTFGIVALVVLTLLPALRGRSDDA